MSYNFNRKTRAYEVVDLLRETPSTNKKIEILEEAIIRVPHFKSILEYMYNPFKQYYIRELPEMDENNRFNLENYWNKFFQLLNVLNNRSVTGHEALRMVDQYFDFLPGREKEVGKLIFGRSLSAGVSAKSINKAHPDLIPEFTVAKARSFTKKNMESIKYPAIIQEKVDGARCLAFVDKESVILRSGNGNVLTTYGDLENQILELRKSFTGDFVLDGELIALNKKGDGYLKRRASNGLFTKSIKGTVSEEEFDKFIFVIWDVIPQDKYLERKFNVPYAKRLDMLNVVKGFPKLRVAETRIVDSEYQAQQFYLEMIERGYEGAVIKNQDSIWEPKRLKTHIKMKVEKDCDLRISEIVEGVGKYEGKLGAFMCKSEDGKLLVRVGSGFSDEQRDLYFTSNLKDKIVTVNFNEVIETEGKRTSKSLYLPIFVEIRDDKDKADTLETIEEM